VSGRPFIGSEVEQGDQTVKGIKRPVVGHHYWSSGSVGRGNGGGGWGVKRGECGAVFGRGGDVGAACARGGGGCIRSTSSRGRRKPGGAHMTVRGEGGGGLGLGEGGGPREE
jgi:hypothetical protein